MRVERVERFLSFPLTSGRKEKKKNWNFAEGTAGATVSQRCFFVFFNLPLILELAFVWPHAVL